MSRARHAHAGARTLASSQHLDLPPMAPPFGVYRPAAIEWQDDAQFALLEAQAQARAFLYRRGKSEHTGQFSVRPAHGTTYIEKGRMLHRHREGVDFGYLLKCMGEFAADGTQLSAPISHLRWCGYEDTVLAASFANDCAAAAEMNAERRTITRILRSAGFSRVPIRQPEHVALCKYEVDWGGRNDLSEYQRQEILRIVGRQLGVAGMEAVTLDTVIVGKGYDEPFIAEEWGLGLPDEMNAQEDFVIA